MSKLIVMQQLARMVERAELGLPVPASVTTAGIYLKGARDARLAIAEMLRRITSLDELPEESSK